MNSVKKFSLSLLVAISSLSSFAGTDPDVNIYFCVGKGEDCAPIGHKSTWDVDDANKCLVLVVADHVPGKKVTVKVFREGRLDTKGSIDDVFTYEVSNGKVCQTVPFKFDRRGDYYVKVYDETGAEIGKGQVDMEEDMF